MSLPSSHDSPLSRDMVEELRDDAPDPRAIERGYRRFAVHRDARHLPPRLGRWLLAGVALAWGTLFAATGDPLLGYGARARSTSVPSAPTASSKRIAPVVSSSSVALPKPAASPQSPPPLQPPASASLLVEEPRQDPKWRRAALALRERDYAEAEAAFQDLENTAARSEAEAASVALAQLLMSRGRGAEARTKLEKLATLASSAVVRERARALLLEIEAGNRSTSPPSETKLP